MPRPPARTHVPPQPGKRNSPGPAFLKLAFALLVSLLVLAPLAVWGEFHFRGLAGEERPWLVLEHQVKHVAPGDVGVRSSLPGLGFVNHANGIGPRGERVNSWGYQDAEFAIPKPKGTVRIAIVGDSMTFGHGVLRSENYPSRLEERLNEAQGSRRFDVVNLGVPGYQTIECFATIQYVALARLEPDLVIYAFFPNDFSDLGLNYWRYHKRFMSYCFEKQDPPTDPRLRHTRRKRARFFLETRSALFGELKYRFELLRFDKVLPALDRLQAAIGSRWLRQALVDARGAVPFFFPYAPNCKDYDLTSVAMEEMRVLVSAAGARFMVLDIPFLHQLDCAECDVGAKGYMERFAAAHPDVPICYVQDDLRRGMKKRGLRADGVILGREDQHPNVAGHELIAEGLHGYLMKHPDLLPGG